MNSLEKIGKCNICCEEKKLTFNHNPPLTCRTLKRVNVESLLSTIINNNLAFDNYKLKQYFQNGIGYETICGKCNSKLGRYYDKTLGKFVTELSEIFNCNIQIPSTFSLKTKPFRLIKGILGHSLSASLNFPNTVLDDKIRPLVFDENKPITESLNIYYYISLIKNPYVLQNFVLVPNYNLTAKGEINEILIKLIHFYPITFLITEDNRFDLFNLTSYRNFRRNESAKIKFNKFKYLPNEFPSTKDFMIILGGDSYVVSL